MAGNLKTNSVTLGDSATDSQNFQLRTNVDGTATLARGAAGNLGDVLTVDASGKVSVPNITTLLQDGMPTFACRAWVSVDCTKDTTGAVSEANTNRLIRGSGNVTSVLKTSVGEYTVNFTTAMPDTNYVMVSSPALGNLTNPTSLSSRTQTVNSISVALFEGVNSRFDPPTPLQIAIFR